jgi:hypothetical protein
MLRLSRRAFLAATVASTAACGKKKDAKVPRKRLSPWRGELRDMFDDKIHPAAVGLAMDVSAPATDPLLRLRAQEAELVARMRIQTVTRDTVGARTTYTLSLQVGQPRLMPSSFGSDVVELSIGQDESSFGVIQSLETQLRGRMFIGFVRNFSGKDGPELHWHLTADAPEVAEVIQEVALLEEMAKK